MRRCGFFRALKPPRIDGGELDGAGKGVDGDPERNGEEKDEDEHDPEAAWVAAQVGQGVLEAHVHPFWRSAPAFARSSTKYGVERRLVTANVRVELYVSSHALCESRTERGDDGKTNKKEKHTMFFSVFMLVAMGMLIGSAFAKMKFYRRMAFGGRGHHGGHCGGRHGHFRHHHHHRPSPFGPWGEPGHPEHDGFDPRSRRFWDVMRDLKGAASNHRDGARDVAKKVATAFEGDDFDAEQMGDVIEDVRTLAEKLSADMLKRLSDLHDELSPRERRRLADLLRRRA